MPRGLLSKKGGIMLRFVIVVIMSFFCVCISAPPLDASSGGVPMQGGQPTSPPPPQQEVTPPAVKAKKMPPSPKKQRKELSPEERQKRRDLIIKEKAGLNNTEWDIEVVPLGGGSATKDTITFREKKVSLLGLSKKKFPPTNYTLTVQENGGVVWETMQTTTHGEVAFIRGEIDPAMETMQGIISFPKGGVSEDYSFISVAQRTLESQSQDTQRPTP